MMKYFERPFRFAIIEEPFTQENQLLTPKMSLRRAVIINKYRSLIDSIYEDQAGYTIPRVRDSRETGMTP